MIENLPSHPLLASHGCKSGLRWLQTVIQEEDPDLSDSDITLVPSESVMVSEKAIQLHVNRRRPRDQTSTKLHVPRCSDPMTISGKVGTVHPELSRTNTAPPRIPQRRSSITSLSSRRSQRQRLRTQNAPIFQSLDGTVATMVAAPVASSRNSISSAPAPEPTIRPRLIERAMSMPPSHITTIEISPPKPLLIRESRESSLDSTASTITYTSVLENVASQCPPHTTILDWTTASTRREEYRKIDEAHSGIRGLWKRIAPRCLQHKRSRKGFWTGKEDDGGSVRRFRMDLPEERERDGWGMEEKELRLATAVSGLVQQNPNFGLRRWKSTTGLSCF